MRKMLMSPTYAGPRGHAAGAGHGCTLYTEDQLYPGCWDAIVSVDVWGQAPAAGVKRAGKLGYSCVKKGCVRVGLDGLDRYVKAAGLPR